MMDMAEAARIQNEISMSNEGFASQTDRTTPASLSAQRLEAHAKSLVEEQTATSTPNSQAFDSEYGLMGDAIAAAGASGTATGSGGLMSPEDSAIKFASNPYRGVRVEHK